MTNHVHLVAVPESAAALASAIGEAHRRFAETVNARQGIRGHLFQDRFFSCPLDEAHLLAAVRYVERNPVRAGLAPVPWEYEWSSAAYHVGLRASDPLIATRDLWGLVDHWPTFLAEEEPQADAIRLRTRTGRVCGGEEFIDKAELITGRSLRPRQPGRKRNSAAAK
jgi:putative transposase